MVQMWVKATWGRKSPSLGKIKLKKGGDWIIQNWVWINLSSFWPHHPKCSETSLKEKMGLWCWLTWGLFRQPQCSHVFHGDYQDSKWEPFCAHLTSQTMSKSWNCPLQAETSHWVYFTQAWQQDKLFSVSRLTSPHGPVPVMSAVT